MDLDELWRVVWVRQSMNYLIFGHDPDRFDFSNLEITKKKKKKIFKKCVGR